MYDLNRPYCSNIKTVTINNYNVSNKRRRYLQLKKLFKKTK